MGKPLHSLVEAGRMGILRTIHDKSLARDRLKGFGQATDIDLRLSTLLDSIPDDPDAAVIEAWEEFVWRVALARKAKDRREAEDAIATRRRRAARRAGATGATGTAASASASGRDRDRDRGRAAGDDWGPWADWDGDEQPALIDFWGGIEETQPTPPVPAIAAAGSPPWSPQSPQASSTAGRERLLESIPVLRPRRGSFPAALGSSSGSGSGSGSSLPLPPPELVFEALLAEARERDRSPSPGRGDSFVPPESSSSAAVDIFYSSLGRHARDADDDRTLRRVRRRILPAHREWAGAGDGDGTSAHTSNSRDTRRDGVVFPDAMDWDTIYALSAAGGEVDEEDDTHDAAGVLSGRAERVRDAARLRRAESLSLREVAHRRSAGSLGERERERERERGTRSSPLRETEGRRVARLPRRPGQGL